MHNVSKQDFTVGHKKQSGNFIFLQVSLQSSIQLQFFIGFFATMIILRPCL